MYAILVMQLHYPPQYVLDDMQMYEAKVAMKYSYYANKDVWEANRLTAYITKEDIERLQKQAENYLKTK